jgi:hypothetical protein
VQLDDTGKAAFDDIYTAPDPRAYFRTLRGLDYQVPQQAKPHFRTLIDEYRAVFDVPAPQVLDIGSSYGINAALLRCDLTMADLYRRYDHTAPEETDDLLAADRDLVATRTGARARFVGLDVSEPALSYAVKAGFLDDAVLADLEAHEPTGEQLGQLAGTNLVISTGCLGYVGAPTVSRVVRAADRLPWMAHFVLRMFPFDPIADALSGFGYDIVRADGLFRQRRFASAEEREQVLDTLADIGVDPTGHEREGWFYAQLFHCRPAVGSSPTPRQ